MSSFWINSTENLENYENLSKNLKVDVCIIGAGMFGLTTGYYLAKSGKTVAILDEYKIGMKASGNTSAKITFAHGLIYDYLISSYGSDFAFDYLRANKEAISNIKKIINKENIDCDFEYQPNYIYTIEQSEVRKIHSECKALETLHEPAEFVTSSALPFKIAGAIKIDNQAQFHPRKYMLGLANSIVKYGGQIFENSQVQDIVKNVNYYDVMVNNFKVSAKYVVVASHFPFPKFAGLYFSKMYQSTSYCLALDTNSKAFDGMFINVKEPIYSFRTAKFGDKRLLILTGAGHKTGFSVTEADSYGKLESFAFKLFPNANVLYKWNTRDAISLDKIPYIGVLSGLMPNCFVGTGFNKWGMTSSNVAANIVSDKILGINNNYAYVFNSSRMHPFKNFGEVKNMSSQVFKSFVSNRLQIPKEDLSAIQNDNGGIINVDGTNIGIYKDSSGNIFAVNPTCTHLGCLLTWNNLDKTWDCPCHGSRFNFKGENLYDPAFKNLEKFGL